MKVNIGLGDGLLSYISDGIDLQRHMASPGHNELIAIYRLSQLSDHNREV